MGWCFALLSFVFSSSLLFVLFCVCFVFWGNLVFYALHASMCAYTHRMCAYTHRMCTYARAVRTVCARMHALYAPYVHACMRVCMWACIYVRVWMYVCVCACACRYVRMCARMYVPMYVRMCARMYVCVWMRIKRIKSVG
jgi:hypothetical protein